MSKPWKDEFLENAWRAAFAGPQGGALVASLERVMQEIPPLTESALQANHGRRSFAAELLAMAGDVQPAYVPPQAQKETGGDRIPGRRIGREKGPAA